MTAPTLSSEPSTLTPTVATPLANGRTSATLSNGAIAPVEPSITLVIPIYNEAMNIALVHGKVLSAMETLGAPWEAIYVDDGSRDDSFSLLEEVAAGDTRVKVIKFRRNFGQTAAMAAGMDAARGKVIIPLDGDGQNDPADIARLLAKMDEGYDVVSGWRQKRKDDLIRKIPSRLANGLISRVTGVPLHDYGCSLKAYRADVIKDVQLYGEMHRFIPAYAAMVGARVTEIPVTHHPRAGGTSKYGIGRVFKVLLDLLVVKFLGGYGSKPIYFFGGAGLWCGALGLLLWIVVIFQKFLDTNMHINHNPLFYVGILLFVMSLQLVMLGLIAEVNIRTYHESQDKTTYTITETRNL